jgi:hypothetical protein
MSQCEPCARLSPLAPRYGVLDRQILQAIVPVQASEWHKLQLLAATTRGRTTDYSVLYGVLHTTYARNNWMALRTLAPRTIESTLVTPSEGFDGSEGLPARVR